LLTAPLAGDKSARPLEGFLHMTRTFMVFVGVALVCIITNALVLNYGANQRAAETYAQVSRWAEQLHGQTTDAGVYVRHPANQLPENDPWGTPLTVAYTQGGFAETLTVRSAGPDRVFYTQDDILVQRSVVNLSGIGKGAKDNIEEFAENGARGLTKGGVQGIKESIQEAIAEKKSGRQKKP
jgi:hypothetical protein